MSCFAQRHATSFATLAQFGDKDNRNGDQDASDDGRCENNGVSDHLASYDFSPRLWP